MHEYLIERVQTFRVKVRGDEEDAICEIETGGVESEDEGYNTLEVINNAEKYHVSVTVRVKALSEEDAIEGTQAVLRTLEGSTGSLIDFEFLDTYVDDCRPVDD